MDKTFYFKYERFENGKHKWISNCSFCDEPEKNSFYLSEGDWDGYAGDLDEWVIVSYEQIPEVTALFVEKYPDWKDFKLNDDALLFKSEINSEEMKVIFSMLCVYCFKDNGSMSSFRKLLEEKGIKSEYSAYRSSSDW